MRKLSRVCLLLVWLLPVLAVAQPAVPGFPDATDTERWVWQELRAGRIANLDARCGATLDPRNDKELRWREECRRLRASFLEWLLTSNGWRAAPAHRGVRISGARVDGRLDLQGARVEMPVWLDRSRFDELVILVDARFDGLLSLDGAVFARGIFAHRLQVEGSLLLQSGATVRGRSLVLRGAKIAGNLELDGGSFEAGIAAESLTIGGHVFLTNGASVSGEPLTLNGSKIGGNLELDGGSFEAGVFAQSLTIGGNLRLSNGASVRGRPLQLQGTRIGGNLQMEGGRFETGINADSLSVGGSLFLRNGALVSGRELRLVGAKIGGNFELIGGRFETEILADGIEIGGSLFLFDGSFARAPVFAVARIGAMVDLSDAMLPGLSLAGANIGGELSLGSDQGLAPRWAPGATLDLRNLRAAAVSDRQASNENPSFGKCPGDIDALSAPNAWPCRVMLQGFSFDRLGGLFGGGEREMLVRDAGYYVNLLARDPTEAFSRQPYQQFAGAFRAVGDKGRADSILYAAREREMAHLWRVGDCGLGVGLLRPQRECWAAVGIFALKITIGYGLAGGYWWAVVWVMGFTLLGVVVLWFAEEARAKGLVWCFGASLDRLLPIIDLSAEFVRFFDDPDPDRRRLRGWQRVYFASHSVAGYILAAFVAAAVAGLTQAE